MIIITIIIIMIMSILVMMARAGADRGPPSGRCTLESAASSCS